MRILQKEDTRLRRQGRRVGRKEALQTRRRFIKGDGPERIPGAAGMPRARAAWAAQTLDSLPKHKKRRILKQAAGAKNCTEEREYRREEEAYRKTEKASGTREAGYTGQYIGGRNSRTEKENAGKEWEKEQDKKKKDEIREEDYRRNYRLSAGENFYRGRYTKKDRSLSRQIMRRAASFGAKEAQEKERWEEARRQQENTMHQAAEPAKRAAVKLLAKAASGLMAVLTALSPLGFFLLLLLVILVLFMSILGYRNIGLPSNVNLNPLVASYRELVTEVSARYEMEEYVDLLLAVMMVDSCGEGQDPMMMSEREYNLEYPRTPGSITEPEYSIDCGVRALQEMLGSVGVVGSTDLVGIRIALQGYNFGRDYIRWMQENRYYEWTYDTACAYAQSTGATQRGDTPHPDGPWNYGNQHYPERVLYYYSLASAAMPEDGLPIPVFHQYDFRQPYGGGTISTSGCGPTCIAMVASYLKNSTITPTDIVNWCGNRYYVEGEGSSWAIFGAAAQHFGLGEVKATYSAAEVRAALEAGRPVISSQAPGLFTQNGHFIVLRGINPEGKILVNDPNDNDMKGYQTRGFDLEREIHRTSKCYWIFEAKTAAAPQQ